MLIRKISFIQIKFYRIFRKMQNKPFRYFIRKCERIVKLFYFHIITIYNNILNVKLSNSQLNKLKSGIKNGTGANLKILLNVNNSNDET